MAIGNPFNDGLVAFPDEHTAFRMSDQARLINAAGGLRRFRTGMLLREGQDSQVHSGMAEANVQ